MTQATIQPLKRAKRGPGGLFLLVILPIILVLLMLGTGIYAVQATLFPVISSHCHDGVKQIKNQLMLTKLGKIATPQEGDTSTFHDCTEPTLTVRVQAVNLAQLLSQRLTALGYHRVETGTWVRNTDLTYVFVKTGHTATTVIIRAQS